MKAREQSAPGGLGVESGELIPWPQESVISCLCTKTTGNRFLF